jgi:hypothetical protein
MLTRKETASVVPNDTAQPVPINAVDFTWPQGAEQRRVVLGIVFQVGILKEYVISRGLGDPAFDGRSPALIRYLIDNLHLRKTARDLRSAILRAVVNNNNLLGKSQAFGIHRDHGAQKFADERLLVVRRYNY